MKGCRPSSSTPYRFANVLSTKHRLKKSTATVESQNTNLIARANSSSLEERRAVFQSLSAFASDPRRRANAPVNTYSALNSAAKLLNNSETTKDKEQKRAMETASVSHDEEHQHAVISFADGAKVRRKSVFSNNSRNYLSDQQKYTERFGHSRENAYLCRQLHDETIRGDK